MNHLAAVFRRADWLAFCVTTLAAAVIYWFTLIPEVDLEYSGIFSTGAFYPGIPFPPGFPVWTAYSWVFTKLPFAPVAFRVAFGSSVAAALTCGFVALIVARTGMRLVHHLFSIETYSEREREILQLTGGCVAGLGLGLDGCFWQKAVVADPWPLSLLLFALAFYFLLEWFFKPERSRFLFAAALSYGFALCNNQVLLAALPGIMFFVAIRDFRLGRDLCLLAAVLLWSALVGELFFEWLGSYSRQYASQGAQGAARPERAPLSSRSQRISREVST